MEEKHRYILIKMYAKIVKDLNVDDILSRLIAEGIVGESFADRLRFGNAKEFLSHLISSGGPEAFSVFKEALRCNYDWMANEMDELEQQLYNGIDVPDASPLTLNSSSFRLPAIPSLNVCRKRKMEELRDQLTKLQANHYLALHALPGWGKSTLVGATLKKYLSLYESFKNEVYWIKFRQNKKISDTDLSNDILNQLNELLHEVRNSDQLTEPTNRNAITYALRRYFSNHRDALIILDHAEKKEIIDAFDFGCKTLVLTTDIHLLGERDHTVIKMNEGFTVDESLDLFAKAIGTNPSSLPKEAQLLHKECNGMPLMISMYAARFKDIKESLLEDRDGAKVWSAYLNDLRKKSPILQEGWKKLTATFEMCMTNLKNDDNGNGTDDARLYEGLSIFPDDANITSKMLSTAWGVHPTVVHSKMLKFYKKSMVVRQWHESTGDYIYGVHDSMLRYLRDKLGPVELKEYHKAYVEKYMNNCNGDYSKLLRDNYIHGYIGYHLEESGLTDKFSEIYLNFGFIESKIIETGPGDLLIDLKKYRKYITRDSPDITRKVEDLKSFLIEQASTLAEYRRRNCLDIVQVALKHSNDGFVRQTAECFANGRPDRLYFKLNKQSAKDLDPVSVDMQMQVRAVAFTNEIDMLLAGTDKGKIVWWNCRNRKSLFLLCEKSDYPIKKIVYSENGECFVSLSEDGRAKLFHLKRSFADQYKDHKKTLDAWAKQEYWTNMNSASVNHDYSKITLSIADQKISDIAISTDGRKIAVCTLTGYIAAWNTDGTVSFDAHAISNSSSSRQLISITYMCSNEMLCVVNVVTPSMIILEASDGKYKTQISLGPQRNNNNAITTPSKNEIISILPVLENSRILIALMEQKLVSIIWRSEQNVSAQPIMKAFAQLDANLPFVYTSAVVMKDGEHVATADTGGSVNIYEIGDRPTVIRIFKKSVTSLDTRQLRDGTGCQTICGCTNDTLVPMVHKWKFDAGEERDARRTPLFDAIIESDGSGVTAVATLNKTIKIIKNEEEIAESRASDSKITCLKVFKDGNSVVYSTENKSVFIFDIKHNCTKEIMLLSNPTYFMTVLNVDGNNVIVCQNNDNNLSVWKAEDDDYNQIVQQTGTVMYCALLTNVGLILTVARTEIKLWNRNKWSLQLEYKPDTVKDIKCCSVSKSQNLLAIGNAEGYLKVLEFEQTEVSPRIKFRKLIGRKFDHEITACNFSNDCTLLAVGLKNGEIIIMNSRVDTETRKFKFHLKHIKKLYWSPIDISPPILLSLSNELAWWSMESTFERLTAINKKDKIIHSRSENNLIRKISKEISNIETSLTEDVKPKQSKSLDLGSIVDAISIEETNNKTTDIVRSSSSNSSLSENGESISSPASSSSLSLSSSFKNISMNESNSSDRNPNDFWNNKKGEHLGIEDLLNVIKLDGNSATRIRISEGFGYFVTIDDEGSIYKSTILERNTNNYLNNPGSS